MPSPLPVLDLFENLRLQSQNSVYKVLQTQTETSYILILWSKSSVVPRILERNPLDLKVGVEIRTAVQSVCLAMLVIS